MSDSRVTEASGPEAGMVARPKSERATWPYRLSRMLAGFTSRCSTPCACAAASASAMRAPTSLASAGESTRPASDPPGHSSSTMYGRPSGSTPAS
nr:hypothetical protein [Nonomuraea sp. PA05]